MRLQRVSYLTFWLVLPIAFFAAHGVHAQSVHVESTAYPSVTDERLQHPEAGDWLMYRRTYDGWGFSPLKEITSSNIQKLSLVWSMSTWRSRNDGDRQSRAYVHNDASKRHHRARGQDRNLTVAVCQEVPGRPVPTPSNKPRRRALR